MHFLQPRGENKSERVTAPEDLVQRQHGLVGQSPCVPRQEMPRARGTRQFMQLSLVTRSRAAQVPLLSRSRVVRVPLGVEPLGRRFGRTRDWNE